MRFQGSWGRLSHRVRPEPAIGPAKGRTRWAGPMVNSAKPTIDFAARKS